MYRRARRFSSGKTIVQSFSLAASSPELHACRSAVTSERDTVAMRNPARSAYYFAGGLETRKMGSYWTNLPPSVRQVAAGGFVNPLQPPASRLAISRSSFNQGPLDGVAPYMRAIVAQHD